MVYAACSNFVHPWPKGENRFVLLLLREMRFCGGGRSRVVCPRKSNRTEAGRQTEQPGATLLTVRLRCVAPFARPKVSHLSPGNRRQAKAQGAVKWGTFAFCPTTIMRRPEGENKNGSNCSQSPAKKINQTETVCSKAKGCKSVAAREEHVKVTFSIFYPEEGPQRECVTGDGANVCHGGWWVYRAHGAVINYLR